MGDKESPLDKTEGGTLTSVRPPERSDKDVKDMGERGTSHHVAAVAVCVVGAVMSSMLQFSFVFGE